jgi:hypothetical protein
MRRTHGTHIALADSFRFQDCVQRKRLLDILRVAASHP